MSALLLPTRTPTAPAVAPPRDTEPAAREQMRRQIARLERELGQLCADLPPAQGAAAGSPRARGGCVLRLTELEVERDRLVGKLMRARVEIGRRGDARSAARAQLEAMIAEPRRFKFMRIPRAALGEPGCGAYHCRPRLGLVGMLAGWWEVKLSSGCP